MTIVPATCGTRAGDTVVAGRCKGESQATGGGEREHAATHRSVAGVGESAD